MLYRMMSHSDEPRLDLKGHGPETAGCSNRSHLFQVHCTAFLQAARAASSAAIAAQQQQQQAQLEESRDPLPAFGSGIQFRPTKKVKQQHSAHPAQRAPPAIYLTEEAEDELNADIDNAEDKQRVSQPMMVSLSLP